MTAWAIGDRTKYSRQHAVDLEVVDVRSGASQEVGVFDPSNWAFRKSSCTQRHEVASSSARRTSTVTRCRRYSDVALMSLGGSVPSSAAAAASAGGRSTAQRLFDRRRPQRRGSHVDERDSGVPVEDGRHADDRPVLGPAVELLEGPPGTGHLRDPDFDQHLVWREAVSRKPRKKSAAAISRRPFGPCATSVPPRARTAAGRSDAGSPWASVPPRVPRCRTWGSPTWCAV